MGKTVIMRSMPIPAGAKRLVGRIDHVEERPDKTRDLQKPVKVWAATKALIDSGIKELRNERDVHHISRAAYIHYLVTGELY